MPAFPTHTAALRAFLKGRHRALVLAAALLGVWLPASPAQAFQWPWEGGPNLPPMAPVADPTLPPGPEFRTRVVLPVAEFPTVHHEERPPGAGVEALVIHDTDSPGVRNAMPIARYFALPRTEVSAHYVVGQRGEIIQCVSDGRKAWHAGPSMFLGREKVNDVSIGIELVHTASTGEGYPESQLNSLAYLSADLLATHHLKSDRITGHREVTFYPDDRQDPSDGFPWQKYLARVDEILASTQIEREFVPLDSLPQGPR